MAAGATFFAGGYIESLMALLELHLPKLLQDALAHALPMKAVVEVLDIVASLYGALSCVASSSPAGISLMSRATAAILPLLQLLPRDIKDSELTSRALAGFLTDTRLEGVELKQLCSKQPQLLCWVVQRLVGLLRQRLPSMENSHFWLSGSCPVLPFALLELGVAANEAADVANDCLMLLTTVTETCGWKLEGMVGAVDGAKGLLGVHSEAAEFLYDLERRMAPATTCDAAREQWLSSLWQLGSALRGAQAATPAGQSFGPSTRQVARLVWQALFQLGEDMEDHVESMHRSMAAADAAATGQLQPTDGSTPGLDTEDLQRLTTDAAVVLTLLVTQLGLNPMAAVLTGAATMAGRPWDFIRPAEAARVASLALYLSSKGDPVVRAGLQDQLAAAGIVDITAPPPLNSPGLQSVQASTATPAARSRAHEQLAPRRRAGALRQEPAAAALSDEELRRREAEAQAAAEALLREEEEMAQQSRAAEAAKAAKQRAKRERQKQQRLSQQAQPARPQLQQDGEVEKKAASQTVEPSMQLPPDQDPGSEQQQQQQQQQPLPFVEQKQRRRRHRQPQLLQQDGVRPSSAGHPSSSARRSTAHPPQASSPDTAVRPINNLAPVPFEGACEQLNGLVGADETDAELSLLLSSLGLEALLPTHSSTTAQQQAASHPQQSQQGQVQHPAASPQPTEPASQLMTAREVASTSVEAVSQDLPAALSEGAALPQPEDDSCMVCMEGPKESVLVPCSHQALCKRCTLGLFGSSGAGGQQECPVCRVAVAHYVLQVFRCYHSA